MSHVFAQPVFQRQEKPLSVHSMLERLDRNMNSRKEHFAKNNTLYYIPCITKRLLL